MPRRARLDDLGVGRPHRRRHDDHVGVADVARRRGRRCTRTPSVARRRVTSDALRVRPADRVAQVGQQLGDAAHADAANAHEMNRVASGPSITRSAGTPLAIGRLGDSSTRSTMTRAASGRAKRLTAAASCAGAAARRRAARACARPASRRSARFCSSSSAAPAASTAPRRSCAGGRRWRSAAASRIAARPTAAISASVVEPARQTTTFAALISSSMRRGRARRRAARPAPRSQPFANHREIALSGLVRDLRRHAWPAPAAMLPPPSAMLIACAPWEPPKMSTLLAPDGSGPIAQELGANRVPADEAFSPKRAVSTRRSTRWRASTSGPARRLVRPGCAFCSCSSMARRAARRRARRPGPSCSRRRRSTTCGRRRRDDAPARRRALSGSVRRHGRAATATCPSIPSCGSCRARSPPRGTARASMPRAVPDEGDDRVGPARAASRGRWRCPGTGVPRCRLRQSPRAGWCRSSRCSVRPPSASSATMRWRRVLRHVEQDAEASIR